MEAERAMKPLRNQKALLPSIAIPRCRRCGRPLRDKRSAMRGIGKRCERIERTE